MQGFKTVQTVVLIYMVQIEYLIHILYVFIFHCTKLEDDTDNPITPITDNITLATDLCRFFRKSCNLGYHICNSSTLYFQVYA